MCNPGTLQTAAFVLCLRLSYLVCWFFKGRNSISYHPLSLLELNPLFLKAPGLKPCWFSKSDIKRTHLLSVNPQYQKYLVWGLILFTSPVLVMYPICGYLCGELGYHLCLCPSSPFPYGLLSKISCGRSALPVFQVIFWLSCTNVVVASVYLWDKVSSGSSYSTIFLFTYTTLMFLAWNN